MFSLLIMRDMILRKKYLLILLVCLSFTFVLCYLIFNLIPYNAKEYSLFGGFVSIRIFGLAVVIRILVELFNYKYSKWLYLFIAICSSILFFINSDLSNVWSKLNQYIILPTFMFLSIFGFVRTFSNKKLLFIFKYFGNISLEIYIIHVFVYNIFLQLSIKIGFFLTTWLGIIIYLFTILVTVLIIQMSKGTRLYKFIFR